MLISFISFSNDKNEDAKVSTESGNQESTVKQEESVIENAKDKAFKAQVGP